MIIPAYEVGPNGWPKSLPRFAESFRVCIDHRDYGQRLITGDWEMSAVWNRCIEDFCPDLALAGELGFIARTVPWGVADLWLHYGDKDYPTIHWHWRKGTWKASERDIAEFANKNGYAVELVKWPTHLDAPAEFRGIRMAR